MQIGEHLKSINCEIDTIREITDAGAMFLLNRILVQLSNKKKLFSHSKGSRRLQAALLKDSGAHELMF